MISVLSTGRLSVLALAAGFLVVQALPARAQQVLSNQAKPAEAKPAPVWPVQPAEAEEDSDDTPAEKPAVADANDPDMPKMKDVDVSKLDWSLLSADTSAVADARVKAAAKKADDGSEIKWSSENQANGSSAVSVKQSISPFWDTRVGADMTVAREPTTMSELLAEKSANGGNALQSSGTAWAAITAPGAGSLWDKTAIEARLDPSQDQSKLGTSISKQVPLANQYSVTLQNGYNVTDQGAVAVPGIGGRTMRSYETDQSAKLDIGNTGASVTAGQSLSSADDKWLRKIGAEQKLSDGVTISGSIGETAQGVTNKSVTAGFKKSW
ncbi:hypothetical protein [Bradyrhizobium sp. Tv2a-2]|uniref:hypothetical protein n=1 Tax=Bradyrhizobium sp. Tv2a-2 TaxID=113395 RepID=UPI0004298521|nr:hypothetical protein [Bradyrhizobium sp. Tv2a-2]